MIFCEGGVGEYFVYFIISIREGGGRGSSGNFRSLFLWGGRVVLYPTSRSQSTLRHCHTTEGQNAQFLRDQCDFTAGQRLVSDENSACQTPIGHKILSDGDVNAYRSYNSAQW